MQNFWTKKGYGKLQEEKYAYVADHARIQTNRLQENATKNKKPSITDRGFLIYFKKAISSYFVVLSFPSAFADPELFPSFHAFLPGNGLPS